MRVIPMGTRGSFALTVAPKHLASQFKDAILPPVLATPMMILMMENAALNAIRAYLDPGESAVGSAVCIRHLAGTPVGHRVTAIAEVTKVTGRRVEFAVSARDEVEEIGNGTRERTVIDVQRLMQHLEAKGRAG
jgi:fluoroacetyl-CoA thioesterase